MAHELARLVRGRGEAQAVHDVVEAALEELSIFSPVTPFDAGRLGEVAAELALGTP